MLNVECAEMRLILKTLKVKRIKVNITNFESYPFE